MPKAIEIEQYFEEFASASALAEAGAFPTVEEGKYRLQVTKYDGKQFDNDPRPYAHLTIAVQDEQGLKKQATVFTDITWIAGRDGAGKLDRGFRLYEQLTRALYPGTTAEDRSTKDVGTVLNDAIQYPVSGYVTERFRVPQADGTMRWTSVKSQDEKLQYRTAGHKVANFVANFAPLL